LDDPELILLWRKPFVEQMDFDEDSVAMADQEAARGQMTQWLRSVVAGMMHRERVRLIEPYADQRLPKLFQLKDSDPK
jgi:hypothetical protein